MTVGSRQKVDSFQAAVAALRERVKEAAAELAPVTQRVVHRCEVSLPRIAPLRWLAAQPAGVKLYWRGREDENETAGLGAAMEIAGSAPLDQTVLQRRMAAVGGYLQPGMRLFGGVRFDLTRTTSANNDWRDFDTFRFVLPQVELVTTCEESLLRCHLMLSSAEAVERILRTLEELVATEAASPAFQVNPRQVTFHPGRKAWDAMVGKALAAIESHRLAKVVLARCTEVALEADVNPFLLLERLLDAGGHGFSYGFQPAPGRAFVGVSPERLYRRRARQLVTEALAGTQPRGTTPQEDAALADRLLKSDKDRREHELVEVGLWAALGKLCRQVEVEGPVRIMKLPRVQHLLVRYRGTLRRETAEAHLLSELHPTPAVAGWPVHKSREVIARLEPFDRGWYAGALGWINRDEAEFTVGLRGALVCPKRVVIFTGSGIVSGSTAAAEWREIDSKQQMLLSALRIDESDLPQP